MLQPSKLARADYARAIYVVTADVPLTQVLEPDYWTHVAGDLKIGDRLEIYAADNSYYAELMVRGKAKAALRVVTLNHVEFEKGVDTEADSAYRIEHRGPIQMYSVIRKADGEVVSDGHQERTDALRAVNIREQELAN